MPSKTVADESTCGGGGGGAGGSGGGGGGGGAAGGAVGVVVGGVVVGEVVGGAVGGTDAVGSDELPPVTICGVAANADLVLPPPHPEENTTSNNMVIRETDNMMACFSFTSAPMKDAVLNAY